MPTQAQSDAARANGAKSRGPVTPEGKAKSAQNALKHGAFAASAVLPTECLDEFDNFAESLYQLYQPANLAESLIVDRIVAAGWRERRLLSMEYASMEVKLIQQHAQVDAAYKSVSPVIRTAIAFADLCNTQKVYQSVNAGRDHCARQASRAHRDLEKLRKSAALLTPGAVQPAAQTEPKIEPEPIPPPAPEPPPQPKNEPAPPPAQAAPPPQPAPKPQPNPERAETRREIDPNPSLQKR